MKKLILFLLGFIPLVLGFLMNSWMMKNQSSILPFNLIGIFSLAIWTFIGYKTYEVGKPLLESAIIVNLPAFLALLLNLVQEIILGRYWFNVFGVATQFFYLPLISLSSTFTFWSPYLWTVYIVGFILMFVSYYMGGYFRRRSML